MLHALAPSLQLSVRPFGCTGDWLRHAFRSQAIGASLCSNATVALHIMVRDSVPRSLFSNRFFRRAFRKPLRQIQEHLSFPGRKFDRSTPAASIAPMSFLWIIRGHQPQSHAKHQSLFHSLLTSSSTTFGILLIASGTGLHFSIFIQSDI